MIFRTHPLLHIAYIHIAHACAWGKLSHPHKRRPASIPQCIKCTLGNNHDVHARVSAIMFMLKFVGLWGVYVCDFRMPNSSLCQRDTEQNPEDQVWCSGISPASQFHWAVIPAVLASEPSPQRIEFTLDNTHAVHARASSPLCGNIE